MKKAALSSLCLLPMAFSIHADFIVGVCMKKFPDTLELEEQCVIDQNEAHKIVRDLMREHSLDPHAVISWDYSEPVPELILRCFTEAEAGTFTGAVDYVEWSSCIQTELESIEVS